MTFIGLLIAINIGCFLPMYLLNIREQPNPFAFLHDTGYLSKATLRLLYARKRYTDPFRINFDYTFIALIAAFLPSTPEWLEVLLTTVLVFGFFEILYTLIMHLVFRRTPSLASDIKLLQAGWSVAYRNRFLIVLATLVVVTAVSALAAVATSALLSNAPRGNWLLLVLAAFLLAPCLYHWRLFLHSDFIWRVTYSPLLHLYRNIQFDRSTREILRKDAAHFERLNAFGAVSLDRRPDIIVVCIESYGGMIYSDAALAADLAQDTTAMQATLAEHDYHIASSLSEAPIFAGGSWLSYTSLTYGTLFNDAYIYDALFSSDSDFGVYESLFHILERNGYSNNLLCPLGGVASRYVDWDSIDRNFRPQQKFDFEKLNYTGDTHRFFVPNDLYAAPDQYSLNYAYDSLKAAGAAPVSLFFCTLNSHYPWPSHLEAVDDWRQLNQKTGKQNRKPADSNIRGNYVRAIRYQLDYLTRFVADNADDDIVLIAFGDHQPPVITPEAMGRFTPLHVIARDKSLLDSFYDHGFSRSINPVDSGGTPIAHQGFLSLFMRALNRAYGRDPTLELDFRESGVDLLHD